MIAANQFNSEMVEFLLKSHFEKLVRKVKYNLQTRCLEKDGEELYILIDIFYYTFYISKFLDFFYYN